MLFMVAALFSRSALQLYLQRAGNESSVAADISYFVMLPIVVILMWPILRENGPAMRCWFRPPASWPALIAYSVVLGVLLRIIYWACITAGGAFGWLYDPNFPPRETPQFSFVCPTAPVLTLAVIARAILTPLFEELIHRGYIFHALLPRGEILAIVLSAVFFGLLHHVQTIITAFLIGLILAILTLKLRTLWGPIIVHATYNLATIIDWDCLHAIWNPVVSTPRRTVIAYVASAALFVCVATLLWLLRQARTGTQFAPRP